MWAKVDLTEWEADINAHWWWTGATAGTSRRNPEGYGRISAVIDGKSRTVYAHRFFFELLEGPIPDGLQIDHLCRVTLCANPDHLEPVTPSTNTRRSKLHPSRAHAAKTHCINGHPFSGENLRLNPDGKRGCRACGAAHHQRRYVPSNASLEKSVARLRRYGYTVIPPEGG